MQYSSQTMYVFLHCPCLHLQTTIGEWWLQVFGFDLKVKFRCIVPWILIVHSYNTCNMCFMQSFCDRSSWVTMQYKNILLNTRKNQYNQVSEWDDWGDNEWWNSLENQYQFHWVSSGLTSENKKEITVSCSSVRCASCFCVFKTDLCEHVQYWKEIKKLLQLLHVLTK